MARIGSRVFVGAAFLGTTIALVIGAVYVANWFWHNPVSLEVLGWIAGVGAFIVFSYKLGGKILGEDEPAGNDDYPAAYDAPPPPTKGFGGGGLEE